MVKSTISLEIVIFLLETNDKIKTTYYNHLRLDNEGCHNLTKFKLTWITTNLSKNVIYEPIIYPNTKAKVGIVPAVEQNA